MPRDKADAAYLWDMLQAAEAVVLFSANRSFEDYVTDALLRSAIERQIEIIGEAARYVSDEFKAKHNEIPWRKIMVQRHVIAHEYADLQHDLLWRVVTVYVPELIPSLKAIAGTSQA